MPLGYFKKKNIWLSLSSSRTQHSSSSSRSSSSLQPLLPRILLISPTKPFFFLAFSLQPFFFLALSSSSSSSATNHREGSHVAVKRSHEPRTSVHRRASSASVVEVSISIIFHHWCRSRETWICLRIRWSVNSHSFILQIVSSFQDELDWLAWIMIIYRCILFQGIIEIVYID